MRLGLGVLVGASSAALMGETHFPAFVAPGPPPLPAGVGFNTSFGSSMVLQQSPAKACLYGTIGAGGTGAKVTVDAGGGSSYDVNATVTGGTGGYKNWKACLVPTKAGGDYTVSATCAGCVDTKAAVLEHVVFGEVWYCGGQSNSKRECVVRTVRGLY